MLKLPSIMPWRTIVTVLITIIVLLVIGLYIAQARIKNAQRSIGECAATARQYQALVGRQNAAVEALKREGERRVEKVVVATNRAAATREKSAQRASAILASVAPSSTSPSACESAAEWSVGEARKLSQDWRR